MAVMSCGIAILGLLQSSAAVVIGAMLISPLMGPIVQLGFSLCLMDMRMMARSLFALLCGIPLALATAMLIVWLSPLREATSEILARTHPTLFDLLVAVLSGLAGGYAVITRKGEAIVGVAIATALMPPLAVVAFGLANSDLTIAGGAAFLFMTNLLAIALSVTLIAWWYGFGDGIVPRHAIWQGAVIFGTFLLLALPLGRALGDIGRQAWSESQARSVAQSYLDEQGGSIQRLDVVRRDRELLVDLVAMVANFQPDAQAELEARLQQRLAQVARVRIRQILEANDKGRLDRADLDGLRVAVNALTGRVNQLRVDAGSFARGLVQSHLDGHTADVEVDAELLMVSVVIAASPSVNDEWLSMLHERLHLELPGWTIVVQAVDVVQIESAIGVESPQLLVQ